MAADGASVAGGVGAGARGVGICSRGQSVL